MAVKLQLGQFYDAVLLGAVGNTDALVNCQTGDQAVLMVDVRDNRADVVGAEDTAMKS